jgi:putative FmdB family regulatory protein
MPIYEYRCRACTHRFETLHARSGEAVPDCPRCGAPGAERLLSAFAVIRGSRPASAGPCGSADCACRRE